MRLWPLSFTPHLENKPGPRTAVLRAITPRLPTPPNLRQPCPPCQGSEPRGGTHCLRVYCPSAALRGTAGGETRAGQVLTAFDPQPVSPLLWGQSLLSPAADSCPGWPVPPDGLIIQTAQGHGPWVGASLLMLGWVSTATEGGWS